MLNIILTSALLACAFRERGQGHSWLGTTGARLLFWALPVGAVVYALSPAGWVPAAQAGAAAFLGLVLVPISAGQNLAVPWGDVARDGLPGIDRGERLGYLLAAGVTRSLLIALPLLPSHPNALWLLVGGACMPLAYLAGLCLPALPWRLTRATEWGEFLTGAAIGAALPIALS